MLPASGLAVPDNEVAAEVESEAAAPARLLGVAGAPIGEPVARRSPFVVNTDEALRQAFRDVQSGRF